jgi:hypothetical protein
MMGIATDIVDRRLTIAAATAAEVSAVVEPLFREYGEWLAERLEQDAAITFTDADLARHHDGFRGELPAAARPSGAAGGGSP